MRLLFIRHGEPDYSIDSLTPKGWREAEILAGRISKMDIREFYVSPLGRAKDTASLTLKRMNRTAVECPWLREFTYKIEKPGHAPQDRAVWEWLPEVYTKRAYFFDKDAWFTAPEFQARNIEAEYRRVTGEFDRLLASYGYVREGYYYRAEASNRDTIVFFCHYGVTCVLLSRLMNVSPMMLWHHTIMQPTAVTSLYTEERRRGVAEFRADMIGDISHLYAAGEAPSFSGRFCETFDDDERHD